MIYHAWFSEKAYRCLGATAIYEAADGTKVTVTSVSRTPKNPYQGGIFDDAKYLGEVLKWISSSDPKRVSPDKLFSQFYEIQPQKKTL